MTSIIGRRIEGDQLALLCERYGVKAERVYEHGAELLFIGEPDAGHDCKVMGCGQMHVVRRITR